MRQSLGVRSREPGDGAKFNGCHVSGVLSGSCSAVKPCFRIRDHGEIANAVTGRRSAKWYAIQTRSSRETSRRTTQAKASSRSCRPIAAATNGETVLADVELPLFQAICLRVLRQANESSCCNFPHSRTGCFQLAHSSSRQRHRCIAQDYKQTWCRTSSVSERG